MHGVLAVGESEACSEVFEELRSDGKHEELPVLLELDRVLNFDDLAVVLLPLRHELGLDFPTTVEDGEVDTPSGRMNDDALHPLQPPAVVVGDSFVEVDDDPPGSCSMELLDTRARRIVDDPTRNTYPLHFVLRLGTPDWIRTSDLRLRRATLCSTELRGYELKLPPLGLCVLQDPRQIPVLHVLDDRSDPNDLSTFDDESCTEVGSGDTVHPILHQYKSGSICPPRMHGVVVTRIVTRPFDLVAS